MKHLVVSNRRNIVNATYFASPDELMTYLMVHDMDTLIFAFWSWKVPNWMLKAYKCYGLHTGPLLEGKGKGGSPIDNLKKLGVKITTLCAFEMTEEIDGGRVKLAIPIRIKQDKEWIIGWIDGVLPLITEYLTAKQPEIPEKFERMPNVR